MYTNCKGNKQISLWCDGKDTSFHEDDEACMQEAKKEQGQNSTKGADALGKYTHIHVAS